jgi:hypothetical protein
MTAMGQGDGRRAHQGGDVAIRLTIASGWPSTAGGVPIT